MAVGDASGCVEELCGVNEPSCCHCDEMKAGVYRRGLHMVWRWWRRWWCREKERLVKGLRVMRVIASWAQARDPGRKTSDWLVVASSGRALSIKLSGAAGLAPSPYSGPLNHHQQQQQHNRSPLLKRAGGNMSMRPSVPSVFVV